MVLVRSDGLEDAMATYYILRTLFRTKNEGYESLLNLIDMNTLKDRRYYQALVLIYTTVLTVNRSKVHLPIFWI